MSRNSEYEKRQREKGLIKKTIWVPLEVDGQINLMVQAMLENRNLEPSMLRDIVTGKFRKI